MNNLTTWVLTTDSSTCKIYHYKRPDELTLIKEIQHPENKQRDIELTSGKPGHYKTRNSTHGAYSQPTDPKEIKIDNFSREIAHELDHGRTTHAFKKLIIIAPPHINGLLQHHLNDHVKQLVTHNFEKDYIHLAHNELIDFLKDHTQFPG